MKRITAIFIGLLLCLCVQATVYTPAAVPNPKVQSSINYVCNPDGLIPPEDCDYLNTLAARLEDSTLVELCVVALNDIGETDAFDFCYELFQRWGIGKKGKDTGVLLFIARQSHDVRIMTGGGIEGVLTDATCNRIVQQDMVPLLRKEDWGGALCLGSLRIYEQCTQGSAPEELRNAQSITNRGAFAEEEEFDWAIVIVLIGTIALIVVLALYFERKHCPKCHRRAMVQTNKQVLTRATLLAAGTGVAFYTCKHCGHKMTKTYTIEKELPVIIGGGGHGGGFGGGGFHGGSFGGGGTFGGGAGGKF